MSGSQEEENCEQNCVVFTERQKADGTYGGTRTNTCTLSQCQECSNQFGAQCTKCVVYIPHNHSADQYQIRCEKCNKEGYIGQYVLDTFKNDREPGISPPYQMINACNSCDSSYKYCKECINLFDEDTMQYTNNINCKRCISELGIYYNSDGDDIHLDDEDSFYTGEYTQYCCKPECRLCFIDYRETNYQAIKDKNLSDEVSECQQCSDYRDIEDDCNCFTGMFPNHQNGECQLTQAICKKYERMDSTELAEQTNRNETCCKNQNCATCKNDYNTCEVCKQADSEYRGRAPFCKCLEGSYLATQIYQGKQQKTGACLPCPNQKYSFTKDAESCLECPTGFDCLGGDQMNLTPGNWRSEQFSLEYEECVNKKENCAQKKNQRHFGGDKLCKEGHIGALCETCDITGSVWGKEYGNTSDFVCQECEKASQIYIKMLALQVFQFLLMYISVDGTIRAVKDKMKFSCLKIMFDTHEPTPDEQGILMKILESYFYIIGVLDKFQLELPEQVEESYQSISNPTKTMAFGLDCFLSSTFKDWPYIYLRVLFQMVTGVLQVLLVLIVFFVIQKCRKVKTSKTMFIYTLVTYQFVSMQPQIITMILETLACRTVLNERYIVANVSKKCFTDEYWHYSLFVMIPILFVWGFLIPLILFRKIKKQYDQQKVSQQEIQNFKENIGKSENNPVKQKQIQIKSPKNLKQVMPISMESDRLNKSNQNGSGENNRNFITDMNQSNEGRPISEKSVEVLETLEREETELLEEENLQDLKAHKLESSESLQKYGFMYLEYKNEVYFWEFVKIYQRILIATVLSFYYKDIIIKGIIVFLIVFAYGLLSLIYQPYKLHKHNRLDIQATIIVALSLIVGLFLWENPYDYWKYLGFFLLGVVNLYFVVYVFRRIIVVKIRTLIIRANEIQEQEQEEKELHKLQDEHQKISRSNKELEIKLQQLPKNSPEYQEVQALFRSNQVRDKQIGLILSDFLHISVNQNLLKKSTINRYKKQKGGLRCVSFFLKKSAQCMEAIGARYFGHPTQEMFHRVKILRQNLKKFASNLFLVGVQSGQIRLSNDIIDHTKDHIIIQEENQNLASYSVNYILQGRLTPQQIEQLYHQNENFTKQLIIDNRKYLKQLAQKYAHLLKKMNIQEMYYVKQFEDKFEDLDEEKGKGGQKPIQMMHTKTLELELKAPSISLNKIEVVKDQKFLDNLFSQIQEQEIKDFLEAFKLFDTSNNGMIDKEELRLIMKALGQTITQTELSKMIQVLDSDADECIDFAEFLSILAFKITQQKPHQILGEFFQWFDRSRHGKLGVREVKRIYKILLKETIDDKVAQEIIDQVDMDSDGYIAFEEFLRLVI